VSFSTPPDGFSVGRGTPGMAKARGTVHPRTAQEGPEGKKRYSSTLSLTSAPDGVWWSTPRPGRFTPEKETQYPLYKRLGGPQGRSGRVR
jgi:ribosomal protein L3